MPSGVGGSEESVSDKVKAFGGDKLELGELRSEATIASALWVLDGDARLLADAERRHALRAKLAAGELDELVFEACVFRAVYPNRNYLRFRDEDLAAFAASFVGQPFLRDHNARGS